MTDYICLAFYLENSLSSNIFLNEFMYPPIDYLEPLIRWWTAGWNYTVLGTVYFCTFMSYFGYLFDLMGCFIPFYFKSEFKSSVSKVTKILYYYVFIQIFKSHIYKKKLKYLKNHKQLKET